MLYHINRHFSPFVTEFVPKHRKVTNIEIKLLQQFMDSTDRVLVLTGAGISTESGIPDYRSEGVGLYDRKGHKPIQYQDFLRSDDIRRRYWARNYCGWTRFSSFEPNVGHKCLAEWERRRRVHTVVTQNVDRLHYKAGSENVIEIHGNAFVVKCLYCRYRVSRYLFQQILKQLNEDIITNDILNQSNTLRPDGDIDIDSKFMQQFRYPSCPRCDGLLKPDIIFFGDNVSKDVVNDVNNKLKESDALVIIGSSLQVYSGYRFALMAKELNKPIAILNIGTTRADHFDKIVRLYTRAGDTLHHIVV
ncbi:NAD-dependent protein deacylase Sirt4-like [Oppia nitens]|uniref:NAD-dependent protein deacylase Sirt4-like n=1 Tax=Oppia nitens TaxID=1686743 RepID=UPI0023D9A199|nr:NAD-dependent protein deacylase Sirt4-like [Oppia nitens]